MSSNDDVGLLETMCHAADALQCRVAAGRSQLSTAMLQSEVKQLVVDDTIARMTAADRHDEFPVCLSDTGAQNCDELVTNAVLCPEHSKNNQTFSISSRQEMSIGMLDKCEI